VYVLQLIVWGSKCFSYFDVYTHIWDGWTIVCTCIRKLYVTKCERDPICVRLCIIRVSRTYIFLRAERGIGAKEEKRKFACSLGVLDLLLCSANDCVATAVEKLFGSRIIATAVTATFSWFSSVSGPRPRVVEESLRATKHSRRKCREHNHLELPPLSSRTLLS